MKYLKSFLKFLKEGSVSFSRDTIRFMGLLYFYIPLLIWIVTWTYWWYGLLSAAILVIVMIFMFNRKKEKESIVYSIPEFIAIIAFILLIAYICGWGGFAAQSDDFPKHNGLLYDLATRPWPVYYTKDGVSSRLTYYMGQYIVGGSIGRIASLCGATDVNALLTASYTLMVWNIIGLFIFINFLFLLLKNPKRKLLMLVFFMAIGNFMPLVLKHYSQLAGVDVYVLLHNGFTHMIDYGRLKCEWDTNYMLLRWVFQYTLPTWISFSAFLDQKDEEEFIVWGLPLAFFAPFCLITIIPYMIGTLIAHSISSRSIKYLKKCFSIENILVLTVLSLFFYFYFGTTLSNPNKPDFLHFEFKNLFIADGYVKRAYIFTLLSSALIFTLIGLVSLIGKKTMYWVYFAISVVMFIFLPFINMGLYNDFVNRGMIPANFIIFLLVLKTYQETKSHILKDVIVLFIIISFIGSAPEIEYTLYCTDFTKFGNQIYTYPEITLETNANPNLGLSPDLMWNYYDYNYVDSFVIK